jgi:hypothetical protein
MHLRMASKEQVVRLELTKATFPAKVLAIPQKVSLIITDYGNLPGKR